MRRNRSWLSFWVAWVTTTCACAGVDSATEVDAGHDSGLPPADAGPSVPDAPMQDSGWPGAPDAASPGPWEGPHFVQVVTGSYHSCARTDAGQVYCWGDDSQLQLGEGLVHRHTCGAPLRRGPCRPFAAPVPALEGAVEIAAGGGTTCGLREDGSVVCTGQYPRPLPGLPPLVELTMGDGLVCGITADADLVCVDPVWNERILTADRVTDFTATTGHFCYVREGRVFCGGESYFSYGALGGVLDPPCQAWWPYDHCTRGVWVDLPAEAVEVETARSLTCARTVDEEVYCWGWLDEPETPPTHVPELDGPARELVLGLGQACVLRPSGGLECRASERPLPALEQVVSVDLEGGYRRWGPPHGCAVTEDGAVSCWGSNGAGELGHGRWSDRIHDGIERVRLSPAPDWTPRPLPMATEPGWVPYPTLSDECVIERALRPEELGPFTVSTCGVSRCMRFETPAGANVWPLGNTRGASGLGGVTPFILFTDTHRVYGLVSIQTGEVLAAMRSPADYIRERPDGDFDSCIVDNLEVTGTDAVLTLRSGPFPLRVVHAPIDSLRDVSAPTEIGRKGYFGEEVTAGANAFTIFASSGLEIHAHGVIRTFPNVSPEVDIVGSTVFWHDYRGPRLWAALGVGDPVPLLELSDTIVADIGVEPGRLAWTETFDVATADPPPPVELWTAALSSDLMLSDRTSLGVIDASPWGAIVLGDGQVAYVAMNGDLVLRNLTSRSERRLPSQDFRWGRVWYVADGQVVTGGRGSPVARTPIDAMPLISLATDAPP
ncbi:MAG: hypothetical protein GXP55_00515 [Deltaproteobacteria bacterium]|nr:hypothetical protein [Deltaproteobacteria bacterium]